MPDVPGADETLDLLCGESLRIVQKKGGYRFSIDAILLANFVRLKKGETLLDIGTGCGIIPIYMKRKGFYNQMTGIEIQPALAGTALLNKSLNQCEEVEFLEGDITSAPAGLKKGHFHVAVSNPPFTRKGSGRECPDDSRHVARHEEKLDLAGLFSAASSYLRNKGRLYVIYPSKRIGEVLETGRTRKLEPKRLRFIHSHEHEESVLFVAEFLKNGGAGAVVEEPLYIYAGGGYSEEVRSYYSL